MARRVLLGNRSTGGHGLYISKAGSNVEDCADKFLLFDSRKSRTAQIYAGGSGINFVRSSSQVKPEAIGTVQLFVNLFTGSNQTGKKIIIDGTTVTLSSTTTTGSTTFTSAANIVTDINAASITNITASIRTISTANQRLRLLKNSTSAALVITYPASNSLETVVGISPATYQVGRLDDDGINWRTGSGTTKASLGYVPLILFFVFIMGELDSDAGSDGEPSNHISNSSIFESTQTHIIPMTAAATMPGSSGTNSSNGNNAANFPVGGGIPVTGRFYSGEADEELYECTNANFYVTKIPLGYGYMTNTYFG